MVHAPRPHPRPVFDPIGPRRAAVSARDHREEVAADRAADRVSSSRGQAVASTRGQLTRASTGLGQALDRSTRELLEHRLGGDFTGVRVHTDAAAVQSARSLHARAYTAGRDIVFDAGEYQPDTEEGRRLLAHELEHTTQAATDRVPKIRAKLRVGKGLALDTQGFTVTKSGDVYTCPAITLSSPWNELFTSLLHSPREFTIAGNTNAQVNANLEKHMKARLGIVDFASKKKYGFGVGSAFKMNPAFWNTSGGKVRPQPGVAPGAAIADLNVHPKEYAIACRAATLLTMLGGSKSNLTEDTGAPDADWIPGDWGYIKNTNFPASGTIGMEGENLIYTGNGKFWGHLGPGLDYRTLDDWFKEVEGWNKGAKIEPLRRRPTVGLL